MPAGDARDVALGHTRRWLASLDGPPSADDVLAFAEGFNAQPSTVPDDVLAFVASGLQSELALSRTAAEQAAALVLRAMHGRGLLRTEAERASDGERRVAAAEARAGAREADLVDRMIDARALLAGEGVLDEATIACEEAVVEARRELDEGIEEGLRQRELYGALRQLVAGEPHVCVCEHDDPEEGCARSFEERCRFEAALRSLLGVGDGEA